MIYWSILGENINALVYGKYYGWIHRFLYNPVFWGLTGRPCKMVHQILTRTKTKSDMSISLSISRAWNISKCFRWPWHTIQLLFIVWAPPRTPQEGFKIAFGIPEHLFKNAFMLLHLPAGYHLNLHPGKWKRSAKRRPTNHCLTIVFWLSKGDDPPSELVWKKIPPNLMVETCSLQTPGSPTLKHHIYLSPEDAWKHWLHAVILTLSFQDLGRQFRVEGLGF